MTAPRLADFRALGQFAEAGLLSAELALARAARSAAEGRVPIAGAAVVMAEAGTLTTVSVGNNGRIPAPDTNGPGYPTDHGETSTIRQIADVGAVDWSRVVFATTLSPCIMCTRTLIRLHDLGLDKIVVAEAKSFPGHGDMLKARGMTVVELTNAEAMAMMQRFARTYPWDWAADIGEIPPRDLGWVAALEAQDALQHRLLAEVAAVAGNGNKAGVVASNGMTAKAVDQRSQCGNNPTMSAPMIAMGRAGSAVNLRDCVLVFVGGESQQPVAIPEFGDASLGACELFRPAAILCDVAIGEELASLLTAKGIRIITAGRRQR